MRHNTRMKSIEPLLDAIEREAQRASFPVDVAAYEKVGKDPMRPILCAGSLEAPVCCLGRDLGKDEVAVGEPLVGSAGRLVRIGVHEAMEGEPPPKSDRRVESALEHVLLTNTVPYKPPGNKAYSEPVKERFRPFVAALLVEFWKGDRVITLGTEAFQWFARYAEPGEAEALWKRNDRYEADLRCVLTLEYDGRHHSKPITVCPLPHPSPLNQRWYKEFPSLLKQRLKSVRD
ncbi:MAG TPA: uracil-DNA glycosylase family protein [Isosphaeraceae bacterium]|jgi:uracil-DNA glycosylase|nr:uracil-DNA glycosylase family protein [Isosphaeraceae bacterium]